uniref:HDC13009 n=1 Tax=Drosophila melanogaster TaxID=7227 RepID=Q6IKA5_DROME|nr:TPA_inf: HDC13009 [Drosophila melanogaster]
MAQNKQRAATHSQKDPNPKNPNKANRMWRTTTNQWWQDEPKDPRPHCPQPGGCTLLGPASGIGLDTGYGHGAAAMPNQRTRRRDASAAPEDGEFWGATECTETSGGEVGGCEVASRRRGTGLNTLAFVLELKQQTLPMQTLKKCIKRCNKTEPKGGGFVGQRQWQVQGSCPNVGGGNCETQLLQR